MTNLTESDIAALDSTSWNKAAIEQLDNSINQANQSGQDSLKFEDRFGVTNNISISAAVNLQQSLQTVFDAYSLGDKTGENAAVNCLKTGQFSIGFNIKF